MLGIQEKVLGVIKDILDACREILTEEGALAPRFFLIDSVRERFTSLPLMAQTALHKDLSALIARKAAFEMGADVVLTIMESWVVEGKAAEYARDEEIPISQHPDRKEVVTAMIETREGHRMLKLPITRDEAGVPTFGEVDFSQAIGGDEKEKVEGRFAGILYAG